MPLNLPDVLIIEKNKIASVNPWLVTVDVTPPDDTEYHIVHNTEDITFNGQLYTAFPFQIEIPNTQARGELPTWTLRISNVTRVLQAKLEELNGAVGSIVVITFRNAGYPDADYATLERTLEVMSSTSDSQWITFVLGAPSPLSKRYPKYRFIADHCMWQFKSAECAYAGAATTCKRNLDACRELNNSARFGGFPGMNNYAVRLA